MDDINDLKDRLAASERLTSLGLLTAGIAHEVKNPLNFVTNFSDLSIDLARELEEVLPAAGAPLTEDQRADMEGIIADLIANLEKVVHHGKRADRIVKTMLDLASGRPPEVVPTDLNALVDDAVALAYHGLRAGDSSMNVSFDKKYGAGLGAAKVAPGELSRVLINMVNNACFALHQRRLAEGPGFKPVLTVATIATAPGIEIHIKDNGPGIPTEVMARLFSSFNTTKAAGQGSGLGLVIARDIIERVHGGTIAVETAAGVGTTFTLRLPQA